MNNFHFRHTRDSLFALIFVFILVFNCENKEVKEDGLMEKHQIHCMD